MNTLFQKDLSYFNCTRIFSGVFNAIKKALSVKLKAGNWWGRVREKAL